MSEKYLLNKFYLDNIVLVDCYVYMQASNNESIYIGHVEHHDSLNKVCLIKVVRLHYLFLLQELNNV